MGIIDRLAGGMIESVGDVADKFITTEEERLAFRIELEKVHQTPELKELEERIQFAQHPSVFVAGGRPFVIWAAGVGIAFNVIAVPLLNWIGTITSSPDFMPIQGIDWDQLMVLAGLAGGASWVRHMDKVKGVARHNLGGSP